MKVTKNQLMHLLHGNPQWNDWLKPVQEILPKYGIDTVDRVAMFFAQCGHESLNFKVMEENLIYSAKGLNAVFSKYFVNAGRDAEDYHRQPEKIANVVYANRMGNGDTASGDGWPFSLQFLKLERLHLAFLKSAPLKSAPSNADFIKSASTKDALLKSEFVKSASVKSARSRIALRKFDPECLPFLNRASA